MVLGTGCAQHISTHQANLNLVVICIKVEIISQSICILDSRSHDMAISFSTPKHFTILSSHGSRSGTLTSPTVFQRSQFVPRVAHRPHWVSSCCCVSWMRLSFGNCCAHTEIWLTHWVRNWAQSMTAPTVNICTCKILSPALSIILMHIRIVVLWRLLTQLVCAEDIHHSLSGVGREISLRCWHKVLQLAL